MSIIEKKYIYDTVKGKRNFFPEGGEQKKHISNLQAKKQSTPLNCQQKTNVKF